jgi:hypothetical protein
MFTPEQRQRVHDRLVEMARQDERVVAAAVVGSRAGGGGDRWSDVDLTFGLAPGASVDEVLNDWTRSIEGELEAARLFDLPFRSSIYRVFMLPGNLQVDISFTPEAEFGAIGPQFELLFGDAVERASVPAQTAEHRLGLGVHHAVRARFCVERGRPWQAEYWISSARDEALGLACMRHGVPAAYARGYDQLPAEVTVALRDGLVRSFDRAELLRALGCVVDGLIRESGHLGETGGRMAAPLRDLLAGDWGKAS